MVSFSPGSFLRLARAGFVLAREGVFIAVDPVLLPPPARLPLALSKLIARKGVKPGGNLSQAFSRLGPSYVKLGQFLATRPDVVGPVVVRELEHLQDRMMPFPREIAVATIEAAFGQPIDKIFVDFGEPLAAASIAQVHRAVVRDATGERDVAVKIMRPGVERRFKRDLSDMVSVARLAERFISDMRRLKLVEVVDTMARAVKMEMDFRLEASAASEFAENTAKDLDFRVPVVDWDRTTKDVLTLEWISGIPLSDVEALAARGYDLPDLGRVVIQSFLRQAMRDGLFHADMHQGNLFIDDQQRLVAVDFGIMGRLNFNERRFLAEIIYGFITRDYRRVAEVHFEAGYVPRTYRIEDFAQAIRAIGEPIHSRTADQISMARLLTLLFEVTALFEMKTRTELVMLQKTMVVVEGVARKLDPKLDMWSTSEPVVRRWIEDNLGPLGKIQDAGRALAQFSRFASDLPAFLQRTEALLTNLETVTGSGIDLSEASWHSIAKATSRGSRSSHIALWILALAVLAILWRLS
ncbi:2-polyprenylphenol 6-hydroxylase [Beijerinckia indica]|uniref:2-polyprenylphenol 6-hydroxylase n=1 Tax=Beijerinckia indica subsp. indica (strain ATCC 9039 / DSM 1715 / NCIMB 8712) TaxID=395963 RepID=B2IKJ6_BEII9|nr:2-polyprenylphenol 6-hydroxylase [Beijerinckia indica]ACB96476.1 2-polyprenylphenol 6-hydroxylase [Beijerinckia indica subsp. indica ATCC 9039]